MNFFKRVASKIPRVQHPQAPAGSILTRPVQKQAVPALIAGQAPQQLPRADESTGRRRTRGPI